MLLFLLFVDLDRVSGEHKGGIRFQSHFFQFPDLIIDRKSCCGGGLNIWINSSIRMDEDWEIEIDHKPPTWRLKTCHEALEWTGEKLCWRVWLNWQCKLHPLQQPWASKYDQQIAILCKLRILQIINRQFCQLMFGQTWTFHSSNPCLLNSKKLLQSNLMLLNEKNLNPIVCFDSLFTQYLHIMNTNGIMGSVCARSYRIYLRQEFVILLVNSSTCQRF